MKSALSMLLGTLAIRRRDVAWHQNWMYRSLAIGLDAAAQALTHLPLLLLLWGAPDKLTLALMLGAGWVVNLTVAEWLICIARVAKMRAVTMGALCTTSCANPSQRGELGNPEQRWSEQGRKTDSG